MKEPSRDDLQLPEAPAAGGSYCVVKRFSEKLLYVSGCGPNLGDTVWRGALDTDYTTQQGAQAAENCARNMLAAIRAEIGSLDALKCVVKLLVLVAGPPQYAQQSIVANGATDFLMRALGDPAGRPARSAIGVSALPNHIPVEIEGLFELQ